MEDTTTKLETMPIRQLRQSLPEVYRFCTKSIDPRVAMLASMGVESDAENVCISIAAEIADWLSHQTYLLSKQVIRVVCPVLDQKGKGIDCYDATRQTKTVEHAVAMLLGRHENSMTIEIAPIAQKELYAITDCVDGRWLGASQPKDFGDAIWLGCMRAENVLRFLCFSDDLASAVFNHTPVGLSAESESDLSIKQDLLKMCGFYIDPTVIENQLSDRGPGWQAYRRNQDCILDCTKSYIIGISGHNELPVTSANVHSKLKQCERMLTFSNADADISVELVPDNEFKWNLAFPGTILKSKFDTNQSERYHVIDSTWMLRVSDGALCQSPAVRISEDKLHTGYRAQHLTLIRA